MHVSPDEVTLNLRNTYSIGACVPFEGLRSYAWSNTKKARAFNYGFAKVHSYVGHRFTESRASLILWSAGPGSGVRDAGVRCAV